MNREIFLNPILERLREYLSQQVQAYATHLRIPEVWLLQYLNTNLQPDAVDAEGATVIANGLAQFSLRQFYEVDMAQSEDVEQNSDDEACGALCLTCAFENRCGELHSYYDFYAALTWPEMIGKADDWEMQHELGPYSREAFKGYVRSTVPPDNRELVFGEAG